MLKEPRLAVLVVSATIFALATTFVALRFYSKIMIVKKLRHHDYWSLLAWIIDFAFSFSLFYATAKGLGLPAADIKPENRGSITRATFTFTVLYNPALMTVKTSILVFYLTFARGEKLFRLGTYVTLFVVNVSGLALTFLTIFQCRPVGSVLLPTLPATASCTSVITLYLSSAPVNIITDIAILFLPMPILTKMHLPRRQKYILLITFGFGFFVTVVDVIRIAYLQDAMTESRLTSQSRPIHSGSLISISCTIYATPLSRQIMLISYALASAALSFMWSVVEVNMSVICTNVPLLKPLIARVMPRMIGVSGKRHGRTTGAGNLPDEIQGIGPSTNISLSAIDPVNHSGSRGDHPGPSDEDADDDNVALSGVQSAEFQPGVAFVEFVRLKRPKNMLKLNNRESLAPIALVTLVFWLWGFSYGLLGNLSNHLQAVLGLDTWESLGIHAAYFSGYLVSPVTLGRWVLKGWGYKATLITGLSVYACGTLIFWPSAVLSSFPAFIVSNFIVGSGLGVLETAANSFIALCGPQENAEIRLNISQAIQAIASVVSPLLSEEVLFKNVTNASALINAQWTYLGIAFFDLLLAAALYYLPIPEAPDDDLEQIAIRCRGDGSSKMLGVPVMWLTLSLGVGSLYLYVAGQEVLATSFESLVAASNLRSNLTAFDYVTIGHTVFAVGRFLTALALWFLKPRWILMIAYAGMVIFSTLCLKTSGLTAVAMGLLIYLFESGAFSTLFAICLRGMGKHTKTAASLLASAIGGGAFLPFVQHAVSTSHGVSYSYSVLVAIFSTGAIFPLYLNLVPAAKRQVDPVAYVFEDSQLQVSASEADMTLGERDSRCSGGILLNP
ncbi:glucose/galactose transporter [Aspergillus udagawae]|nr:glucose/galactose transporter [Aspergillus udagawae]